MQTITDGFYYQEAYSGVTLGAIILPEGTLIIDTPFRPEQARSWRSVVTTQSRGTHRLVVNLDEHIDRTLGNRYIDLTMIAHHNTAKIIDNRANVFKGHQLETGSEWEKFPEIIGSRWICPDITFGNHLHINWGEYEIQLNYRPGPALGAIWVEIPSEQILYIGDAVVANQPPFLANADIPAWLETLSLLRSRKYSNYTIISGRSGPVTAAAIKDQQAFLKTTLSRIDAMAKQSLHPNKTSQIIPALLSKLDSAKKYETYYTQRLQYGLRQYYLTHYYPDQITQEE